MMKDDKGITLVTLVVTVILMGILMALLVRVTPFNQLLQENFIFFYAIKDVIKKIHYLYKLLFFLNLFHFSYFFSK